MYFALDYAELWQKIFGIENEPNRYIIKKNHSTLGIKMVFVAMPKGFDN